MKGEELSPEGFTLFELIVVLLLLSLALGMVAPRVSVGLKKLAERDFVMTVVQLLNRAKFRAISLGRESIFLIDGTNKTMGIDNVDKEKIPENVDIYSKGLEQISKDLFAIRFFPDGTSRATDLEITFNEKHQYFISIDPFTGRIFLKNGTP